MIAKQMLINSKIDKLNYFFKINRLVNVFIKKIRLNLEYYSKNPLVLEGGFLLFL